MQKNVWTYFEGPNGWAGVFLPHLCNQQLATTGTERKSPKQIIVPDGAGFTDEKYVLQ